MLGAYTIPYTERLSAGVVAPILYVMALWALGVDSSRKGTQVMRAKEGAMESMQWRPVRSDQPRPSTLGVVATGSA